MISKEIETKVKIEFIKGDVRDIIRNIYRSNIRFIVKVANDLMMNGMILMDKKLNSLNMNLGM